ncbi:MAG TPA: thioredoxin family protein [Candidatus Eisenbacteria bacterium]|nr:thioredoxin family protein [Candidatus Eisenbacteria bacterium]
MRLRSFFAALVCCSLACAPAFAAAELGKTAPEFTLTDPSGQAHSLSEYKGRTVVLEWTNPECPFVRKHYASGNMQGLQKTYTEKGVAWLTINSSAPGKQGNLPAEEWLRWIEENGVASTAVLLDPEGRVGRLYGAKTTPHLFVIAKDGNLVYQGAIDSVPGTDPAELAEAKNYVRAALDETLSETPVSEPSTRSYGCSVKY